MAFASARQTIDAVYATRIFRWSQSPGQMVSAQMTMPSSFGLSGEPGSELAVTRNSRSFVAVEGREAFCGKDLPAVLGIEPARD